METAKANLKFMDRLSHENGSQITTQKGMLQEQVKFYNNVFDKNGNFVEEDAEMLSNAISLLEINKVIILYCIVK